MCRLSGWSNHLQVVVWAYSPNISPAQVFLLGTSSGPSHLQGGFVCLFLGSVSLCLFFLSVLGAPKPSPKSHPHSLYPLATRAGCLVNGVLNFFLGSCSVWTFLPSCSLCCHQCTLKPILSNSKSPFYQNAYNLSANWSEWEALERNQ